MVSRTAWLSSPPAALSEEVPLWSLYVLRAAYLLLVVGLGAMIAPILVNHDPDARGVIPSLLGGIWVLAFLGLRYPVQMLPLLMFEFAWKLIWFLDFGVPQWMSGQKPPTFAEDSFNIILGVILMPIVIPWGYIWRHYVKQRGDRWR
jgi:hypothetical protein